MPTDFFGFSGHVIDGHFHVIEVAGEGGFSVVYRGQHLTLREPVAIKCLKLQTKHENPAIVASFTQRFFDESRIMYRLSQGNLNIVRAITTGVTVSPTTNATVPYMVLEWLEGVSLARELKERRAKKLPPPRVDEVLAQFEPAALAIAYAHSQGVVHRDVKPGNLFLCEAKPGAPRQMKVLDFGMAKVLSPESMGGLESAQTLGGVMVMSPQYVTPEQLDQAHGAIGPWTDVYAFALIVLEALTNRRARDAENFADLMLQITRDQTPSPRRRGANVNDAVERVFERALARDPKARQPDLGVFWRELRDAAASNDDANELQTHVDMQLPTFAFGSSTLAIPSQRAQPKADFSKTMPLSTQKPFSGTVPLSVVPEASAARVAALEAVRPSIPQAPPLKSPEQFLRPSSPPQNQPPRARSSHVGRKLAKAERLEISPPAPAPSPVRRHPRGGSIRMLSFVLLLVVIASLSLSGLLLARIFLHT